MEGFGGSARPVDSRSGGGGLVPGAGLREPRARPWRRKTAGTVTLGLGALLLTACSSAATAPTQRESPPGGSATTAAGSGTASTTTTTTTTAAPPTTTTTTPAGGRASETACLSSGTGAAGAAGTSSAASIQFVSPGIGFAAGGGEVLATTDAGGAWTVELRTASALGQLDFVSATDGWIPSGAGLLATTDGGHCWVDLGSGGTARIDAVHFYSPTDGWGLAGSGLPVGGVAGPGDPITHGAAGATLVATTDGGRSWHSVPGSPRGVQSACTSGGTVGFASTEGRIWRTADGGASWSVVANPGGLSTGGNDPAVIELSCAGATGAWAVVNSRQGAAGTVPWAIYASPSGTSWTPVAQAMLGPAAASRAPGSTAGQLSPITPTLAAATGFTPAEGRDGTANLAFYRASGRVSSGPLIVPSLGVPEALAFVSSAEGFAIGDTTPAGAPQLVLMATTDGGATWHVQAHLGG